MSITARFSLGIGLLLSLIVTVALTGYLSIYSVRNAQNAIRMSTDIQRMVLAMDRGMERARRLHADFFLQYPAIGLAAAHEQYAQPSVRQVARVIAISNNLRDLIEQSPVSEALLKSRVDLNLYLSSAKRFADTSIRSVELVTDLAAPVRGLEAQLDYHLEALGAQIRPNGGLDLYAGIRTYVQEYRIRRRRFLMQSAFNTAFQLRNTIDTDPGIKADQKGLINDLLDRFVSTAEKIIATDVAIKAKFNDFALQAKSVEPISNTLVELASAEVSQARTRIAKANQTASVIMAFITLAGLVLGTYIARVLNNSITRRVTKLTTAAGELRTGNLNISAEEQGQDELSDLAHTFNVMAARIRELVNHLELKVDQRTAELVESERRFRHLFEHSSSGVAIYLPVDGGKDFTFQDINKAVERIEQVKREEIVGKKVTEVFPGVAEFGLLEVLQRVARTGRSARHPASLYADGRLTGWRDNSVYRLPSGEIVAIYDDLTAQKQAELEKKAMENQLHHARKMEAIGVLAGGIAHDFNNILGIILGNAELAIDDIPEWNPAALNLEEIRIASLRAKDVIRQLLSFSRKSEVNMEPVSICPLLKESLTLMRASISANITIQENISDGCGAIVADPTQIHQVMINLCTNAAHAMEKDGGILQVKAFKIQINSENAIQFPGMDPGAYVQLTVSDTGSGMAPDIRRRIFDPYFTTKEIGKGTGMGLAVVHGIVKSHGGIISVDSEPGRGSAFKLIFPAIEAECPQEEHKPKSLPGGNENVLLVDDETALLNSIGGILERLGYRVESTADPSEAYAIFKADPNAFDLIITDMAMPKITGDQLASKILGLRPTVPVILCSGYSETIGPDKAKALGIRKYLQKPLNMNELAAVVREVLD